MPEQRLRESVLDFTTYNMISDALDTFPKILQYIKWKTLGKNISAALKASGITGPYAKSLEAMSKSMVAGVLARKLTKDVKLVFEALLALREAEDDTSEDKSDGSDTDDPGPQGAATSPAQGATLDKNTKKLLAEQADAIYSRVEALILSSSAQKPTAQSETYAYTRDLQRWKAALEAGAFAQQADAFFAEAFKPAMGPPQPQMRAALHTMLCSLKDIARVAPPSIAWTMLLMPLKRTFSYEAAADLHLRNGTLPSFITAASSVLVCEPDTWEGSQAAIARKVEEHTREVAKAHRQQRHEGGRYIPRARRGRGGRNNHGGRSTP
mgnify:CR=1 FL=1